MREKKSVYTSFFSFLKVTDILALSLPKSFVSWFGLEVRHYACKQKDLGSVPLQLSFLFIEVCLSYDCLVLLPLTINATLKWLSSLHIVGQKFWW